MLHGSQVSLNTDANSTNCVFCQRSEIASILKETPHFLVIADHAPLVEGHLLIIPKQHLACYGVVPAELDCELFALKHEVQRFLAQFYAPIVFWEHGIFRQTVFHAHLHCFPFGQAVYTRSEELHGAIVHSQQDIRDWHTMSGQYFYLEDAQGAFLFAPETDRYLQVLKNVFQHGIASRNGNAVWRSPQQRYEEGAPVIAAMATKWSLFQEQGATYADEASA